MRFVLLAVRAVCLCVAAASAQERPFVVEVTGEGSGGKQATIEAVEKQARYNAMQKALEQAGVYLESVTEVELAAITRDEIQAWTRGLVRVLEVLDSRTTFDSALKAFRCEVRLKVEVRTRDMAELLARVKEAQPEQAGSVPDLGFEYLFIGYRPMGDGSWVERHLEAGSVVRADEEFQIWFKPDRDCYAYVINRDASGAVYVLFPHQKAVSNRLEAGRAYMLPSEDQAYQLDAVTGPETFYLAVSPRPMVDLEWIISRIKQADGTPKEEMVAMLEGTLRVRGARGAGRVVPGRKQQVQTPGGRATEQVTQMLQGKGALMRVITLDHR